MRILVTGAAGFIGSNFVRHRLEANPGDHVVAYDLLTYAGVRENVPGEVPFVHGDIGDLELAEQTLAEHGIETVVNFAAESHNSLAVQDPALFARSKRRGVAASRVSTTSRPARSTAICRWRAARRSRRSRPTGRGRRTTPPRLRPTTTSAPTSRPSSCR